MNIREVMDEMDLAAFELAEAATHDREAKRLRVQATKRLANLQSEFREAQREARARKPIPTGP